MKRTVLVFLFTHGNYLLFNTSDNDTESKCMFHTIVK